MATRKQLNVAVLAGTIVLMTLATLGAERFKHSHGQGSSEGVPSANALELPYHGEDHSPGEASFRVINAAGGEGAIAVLGNAFWAVVGVSKASGGVGVGGFATGAGSAGVDGRSAGGYGVYGQGVNGVRGVGSGSAGKGVAGFYSPGEAHGASASGIPFGGPKPDGVTRGYLATQYNGVEGETDVTGGKGVSGKATRGGNSVGVYGENTSGTRGLLATSMNGVQGESDAAGGKGVAGKANGGANAVAIYGESTGGMAGFFRGKVTVTESLLVKEIFADKVTASKGFMGGSKLFQIDHPLEPSEKFLNHASIESAEMKNLYDGVAKLDPAGAAWIVLPAWFQALNQEFRYQLTCIGGYAPVYVDREINQNRFRIAGGKPGMKVSWQVTGVRHDAYAAAHPLDVEQQKTAAQRGRYVHPVELGFPATDRISDVGQPPRRPTARRSGGDADASAKPRPRH